MVGELTIFIPRLYLHLDLHDTTSQKILEWAKCTIRMVVRGNEGGCSEIAASGISHL
jgi:hypothetical protein